MAIAVMPHLLMAVVAAGRDQLVEDGRQVLLEPGLKFDGPNRPRTAYIEHVDGPGFDARRGNGGSDLSCDVVKVAVTGGTNA